jgi:hypothetical protein
MDSVDAQLKRLLQSDIERYGLEPHLAEIDEKGYTVVPPELAAPAGFTDRLLDACLDVVEERSGVRPDLESGSTHVGHQGGYHPMPPDVPDSWLGEAIPMMLGKGRIFEETLMQPTALTIATALVGYQCVASVSELLIKGPNETPMGLHTDTAMPAPFPPYAMSCNCFWMLQDADLEGGATAIVPGSHRRLRNPSQSSDVLDPTENSEVFPIEAKAGSLIVWHGASWHGAFPRRKPGLRVALSYLYSRPSTPVINDARRLPKEVLDRNPLRFSILTQQASPFGGTDEQSYAKQLVDAFTLTGRYIEELGITGAPDLNSRIF